MTIVKVKPTSAGRRGMVKIVTPGLHKGKPVAALTESNKRGSGRNNNGHITTRHRGGGIRLTIESSISVAIRMGSPQRLSGSNTIPIAART